MEPNDDFKNLFPLTATAAADWPLCSTHMHTVQHPRHCSLELQSKRTVLPVTVKKSSSAKARRASSNISLVIAFGEEMKTIILYVKYSLTCQIHNDFNVKNHQSLSFLVAVYIHSLGSNSGGATISCRGSDIR